MRKPNVDASGVVVLRVVLRTVWGQALARFPWLTREVDLCRAELEEIRSASRCQTSWRCATAWSAAAILWGNGVVVAGRRFGADQWITLLAVPAFGLAGTAWLCHRGFRFDTIGLRPPDWHGARPLGVAVRGVAVLTAVVAAAGLITFGHQQRGLRTIRTLVGTAFGEELIHRGVLLALWADTGVRGGVVVAVNTVTFGLWHAAGATREHFHGGEVVVPAVGAVLFLWVRLRLRSVFAAAVCHAAFDIGGVFKPAKAACHCWRPR